MSYTDHSAQRRLESNAPINLLLDAQVDTDIKWNCCVSEKQLTLVVIYETLTLHMTSRISF